MPEKPKTFGKKLKDLFIVDEEGHEVPGDSAAPPSSAGPSEVDDLIARYASAEPGRPAPAASATAKAASPSGATRAASPTAATVVGASAPTVPPPAAPAAADSAAKVSPAKVNFAEVYQNRGISSEEQGRVERALALLNNLPKETPKDLKRQIVEASLAAFGVPIDQIIEAALLHQRALQRHHEKSQADNQLLLDESNQRLKDLEKQMADIRQRMQERVLAQQGLAAACTEQRLTVQEVLDFFGPEAVERVSQLSVKLRSGGPTPPGGADSGHGKGPGAPQGGRR